MVNTALTALGMWALAIPGVGLLSLFTFICSFIPIAGVVISTTPIAFVALTEYGERRRFFSATAACLTPERARFAGSNSMVRTKLCCQSVQAQKHHASICTDRQYELHYQRHNASQPYCLLICASHCKPHSPGFIKLGLVILMVIGVHFVEVSGWCVCGRGYGIGMLAQLQHLVCNLHLAFAFLIFSHLVINTHETSRLNTQTHDPTHRRTRSTPLSTAPTSSCTRCW